MFTTLRRTLRSLKRSPVFFATATISLAIGLGLCTASFLFIDSIQHPHLPYAEVDRLFFPLLRFGNQRTPPSLAELQRAIRLLPAIEQVAVTASAREDVTMGISGNRLVTRVSPNFFALIGIRPQLGRLPTVEEARTQTAAVVTQSVWRDEFHNAKSVSGARLKVGDNTYDIVGVLPRGAELSFAGDVWLPLASDLDLESVNQSGGLSNLGAGAWMGSAGLVVKLRDHTGAAAVDAQLAKLASELTQRFGAQGSSAPAYQLQLRSIRPRPTTMSDFEILMLLIGIGVLAIAATNVAALSLARGLMRKRDFALRIALGASRGAIASEVLAEIGVISAAGAIGGALMAIALIGLMTSVVPEELAATWYVVPQFSMRLFGFSAAALVAAITLAGALPAWRASRVNPSDPLKDSAGTTTGRSTGEFRILIIGELAISMVMLMLASLMALSMRNLSNYEFGFDARHLLLANAYIPFTKLTNDTSIAMRTARADVRRASLERIRAAEGVVSAATINASAVPDWEMRSEAMAPGDPAMVIRTASTVSPSFFATLGVAIVEGRDFLDGDAEQGGTVILSSRAARILFPHGGAVGRMVRFGGESRSFWLPVVGVVRDFELSMHGVRSPNAIDPDPPVYLSTKHTFFDGWGIAIRPRSDDPKIALALQAILRDAMPPRASSSVAPWTQAYESEIRYRAFFAQLFEFIATAAMILGAAGLFSVLSYAVSQRMREFAVRSALGASRRDLLKVVMQYALEMSLAGTAIGALLSFWASAGISSYLWGVKNTDPASLVVAELTLLTITMTAALVPAIRATRADPVEVLRAS